MAVEFNLALQGKLKDVVGRQRKIAKLGVTRGVHKSTQTLKERLRADVRSAGLGDRLAKTWQDKKFPAGRKTSLNAAGFIWSKAPEIIRAHTEGTTIRPTSKRFLAIPTDNVPRRGFDRKKRATPENWNSEKFGPLRFIPGRNGPALLVVDGVRFTKSGRVGKQLKSPRKKSGDFKKGVTTVVMFVLVPQVSLRRRLDPQATTNDVGRQVPDRVKREIRRAEREVQAEAQQGAQRRGR